MLDLDDVSHVYADGTRALDHVSLSIPRGMYGLLGPNGAGKSTLMRTVATLQSPSEGAIRFGDIDVIAEPEKLRQPWAICRKISASIRVSACDIIVDEPTAGLDPEERNHFLNLLAEIGENVVVILSTHIVEDVSDLCPRTAVLAGGRIQLERTVRAHPAHPRPDLDDPPRRPRISRPALFFGRDPPDSVSS